MLAKHALRVIKFMILSVTYIILLIVLIFFWQTGILRYWTSGPKVIQTVASPDQEYVAYVQESPSIDPPNQSLYVERHDKSHFMFLAKLAEDIDSIIKIVWSSDSQMVVFHSKCYLTAVRISDWKIIRIYLGKERLRYSPQHGSTFSSAGPIRRVELIDFPEPNHVGYRLENDKNLYSITF